MIKGMYDTAPARRWTMDKLNNTVAWPEQAHGSKSGAAEALVMDEDTEVGEEDSVDSMGWGAYIASTNGCYL